jgi:hypothetical protein
LWIIQKSFNNNNKNNNNNNNQIEKFEVNLSLNTISPTKPTTTISQSEKAELTNWYQKLVLYKEPQVYQEAYDKTQLADLLKFNLKIDPRRREIDSETGKTFQRLLVPIHMINLLDGKILAVFNDGKLYLKNDLYTDQLWLGPLNNSLYGSQTDGTGMRMIMNFPLNKNQERQIVLLGVGQDNSLYYKETEDMQSVWLKTEVEGTGNDNLVYLFCDYYQTAEDYYPLLYGITTEGKFVYKNLNGENPPSSIEDKDFLKIPFTEPNPPIFDNIKVLKVFWDRNGFMIGIGQDFRLYQKKGIDWKVRPWEITEETRGTNKGSSTQVIDILMDNDGIMVGLVLDSESNPPMIKIQKQNMNYYLADFENIEDLTKQSRTYNDQEMIKFKTGLDWITYLSFEDPDEILYRSNNLQAIYQKSIMNDKYKLRNLCHTRKPTMNLEARNFDLETKIQQKDNRLNELNSELEGLIKYIT